MNERNDTKKFIANTKCGHCGQHYELDNFNVMGQLSNLLLSTIYCPSYNNVNSAVVNTTGDKEAEIITDLTEAEKSHFFKPIGSSDILRTEGLQWRVCRLVR